MPTTDNSTQAYPDSDIQIYPNSDIQIVHAQAQLLAYASLVTNDDLFRGLIIQANEVGTYEFTFAHIRQLLIEINNFLHWVDPVTIKELGEDRALMRNVYGMLIRINNVDGLFQLDPVASNPPRG